MRGLVTVFGGSGFIGVQVVRALAKQGWRVRVAVRNPGGAYRMRMLGDVGQIEVVQANVRAPASIARALDGAEACINLVGLMYEHGRQRFQSTHVMGASHIARAAKSRGITHFVHMSAIGADTDSYSKYARTKGLGERAVREIVPQAVIIRPSIVFGQEDDFFNRFGAMASLSPVLPLIGGGKTRFQPVFAVNVAAAIARAVTDPACAGQTYELGGPTVYSFRELMEMVLAQTGRRRLLVPVPLPIARLLGKAGDMIAWLIRPPITTDQVELLKTDNVAAHDAPGLAELGVTPAALEAILPAYMKRYRKGGQFADLEPFPHTMDQGVIGSGQKGL